MKKKQPDEADILLAKLTETYELARAMWRLGGEENKATILPVVDTPFSVSSLGRFGVSRSSFGDIPNWMRPESGLPQVFKVRNIDRPNALAALRHCRPVTAYRNATTFEDKVRAGIKALPFAANDRGFRNRFQQRGSPAFLWLNPEPHHTETVRVGREVSVFVDSGPFHGYEGDDDDCEEFTGLAELDDAFATFVSLFRKHHIRTTGECYRR